MKQLFERLGIPSPISFDEPVPHWRKAWAESQLRTLFGVSPEPFLAYYCDRGLRPWQAAATWVFDTEEGPVGFVQLRRRFKTKRTLFGLCHEDEVLAHEGVHLLRKDLPDSPFEEFFAYMTSPRKWRQVFGPLFSSKSSFLLFGSACTAQIVMAILSCFYQLELLSLFVQALLPGVLIYELGILFCRRYKLRKVYHKLCLELTDPDKARRALFALR